MIKSLDISRELSLVQVQQGEQKLLEQKILKAFFVL